MGWKGEATSLPKAKVIRGEGKIDMTESAPSGGDHHGNNENFADARNKASGGDWRGQPCVRPDAGK